MDVTAKPGTISLYLTELFPTRAFARFSAPQKVSGPRSSSQNSGIKQVALVELHRKTELHVVCNGHGIGGVDVLQH
jgi:hypothetical protein